jgi:predicted aconitase
MLSGDHGAASQLAMRIVIRLAEVMGADRLLDVTGAHIDSCLYHGRSGLDFAESLVDGGGRVAVPTSLNVSLLDRLHPDLYRGDPETARLAGRLMGLYEEMGCRPTWTCAPYQLPDRPGFGEHVAWAESNAIVFANSVLGARTHRYGDFIDISAAITGRAPAAGLHLDANRNAEVVIILEDVSRDLLDRDVAYPVLGHLIGDIVGKRLPVIVGLPPSVSEDRLKAIGAAAASSGSVGMFHAVGSTPEAPTLEDALGGKEPASTITVRSSDLRRARDQLSTTQTNELGAVCLGTPHYSTDEFANLVPLLAGERSTVPFYVSTGRDVLTEVEHLDWLATLEAAGVQIVTDTCTYLTPVFANVNGPAMTDSGKWAYYAPGNIGVEVVYGSTEDCVRSAIAGRVVRDEAVWTNA